MRVKVTVAVLISLCSMCLLYYAITSYITYEVSAGEKLANDEIEFSWVVALHKRSSRSFFCAGSLISAKHVLSGNSFRAT